MQSRKSHQNLYVSNFYHYRDQGYDHCTLKSHLWHSFSSWHLILLKKTRQFYVCLNFNIWNAPPNTISSSWGCILWARSSIWNGMHLTKELSYRRRRHAMTDFLLFLSLIILFISRALHCCTVYRMPERRNLKLLNTTFKLQHSFHFSKSYFFLHFLHYWWH